MGPFSFLRHHERGYHTTNSSARRTVARPGAAGLPSWAASLGLVKTGGGT